MNSSHKIVRTVNKEYYLEIMRRYCEAFRQKRTEKPMDGFAPW